MKGQGVKGEKKSEQIELNGGAVTIGFGFPEEGSGRSGRARRALVEGC